MAIWQVREIGDVHDLGVKLLEPLEEAGNSVNEFSPVVTFPLYTSMGLTYGG